MDPASPITLAQARAAFWQHGIIAPWHLRPSQLDIYSLLAREKRPHVECARQFGKTTTVLDFVLELLIRNPGWVWRWCEPGKEQCHEIVMPAIDKLQQDIPERDRFIWRDKGSRYRHPNGSILYLRGVNEDRGESSRGPFAHGITADEFGSWRHPRYTVDEVLKPQLETTNGWFIFTGTPPEDLGHLYYVYFDIAQDEHRAIQKTILDNESLGPERIEEIKADCGGEASMAWTRERMLKRTKDPGKVVVPEYDPPVNEVPNDYKRPEHFDAYSGGDNGVDDNTAFLFAYYDFQKDEIVFEDECIGSNLTSAVIVERARKKEFELWGTSPEQCTCQLADYSVGPKVCMKHGLQPFRRVYDANKQVLVDITVEHKFPLEYPDKADKIASIRHFRRQVQLGKIKVKKRCHVLRRQLAVGQWKDEKHMDFQRSEDDELKHLDALAGAIYIVRSVIRTHNPYPQYVGVNEYTHFIDPAAQASQGKQYADLDSALDPLGEGLF